jgi:serine/threonine protein kinase
MADEEDAGEMLVEETVPRAPVTAEGVLSPSYYQDMSKMFRTDTLYQRLEHIGEGAHGLVHKAKAPNGQLVALKRISIDKKKDGVKSLFFVVQNSDFFEFFQFSITAVREIAILKSCSHPNVIPLLDVVATEGNSSFNSEISRSKLSPFRFLFFQHKKLSQPFHNVSCERKFNHNSDLFFRSTL